MKQSLSQAWVKRLRDPSKKQVQQVFRDDCGTCAIGELLLAANELGIAEISWGVNRCGEHYYCWEGEQWYHIIPESLSDLMGLEFELEEKIILLNDREGKTFPEIAEIIEGIEVNIPDRTTDEIVATAAHRMKIADAVETLTHALKGDPQFWLTYKANIAMCMYDQLLADGLGNVMPTQPLHTSCNEGAERFLKLWTTESSNEADY